MDVFDKIATIVPIAHLDAIAHHTKFMALTHLMGNDKYRQFYEFQVSQGKWVVFDNSTVELGEPESIDAYLEKATELGASEILMPDYLFDANRTMDALIHGLDAVEFAGYTGNIMGVPQGRDQNEWMLCLAEMISYGVDSIGISRRYADKFGESRLFACYAARALCVSMNRAQVTMHLLGSMGAPELDSAALNLSYVTGIDSALPAYFAKIGESLPVGATRPAGVEISFENDIYDAGLLAHNIERWRGLCASVGESIEV